MTTTGAEPVRVKLTEAQNAILRALSQGEHIAYSQDGECGWLYPSRQDLAEDDIWALRNAGFIANAPEDEDEPARFGPPDVITEAGRAALVQEIQDGR